MDLAYERVNLVDPTEFALLAFFEETIFPEDAMTSPEDWESDALWVTWAVLNGTRVGYSAVELDRAPADRFDQASVHCPGTIYSIALGVLPQWQGRGIGSKLRRWTFTDAPYLSGRTRMVSTLRTGNTGSRTLHRRHGFVESRVILGFYPDGEDAVVIERML